MKVLDTNILIRFFARDIETEAQEARRIISSSTKIFIPTIVLAETVYILEKHYKTNKPKVIEALTNLLKQPKTSCADYCLLAFEIYKKETVSFYDCLIAAEAIERNTELVTFDKKLTKTYRKHNQ